MKTPTTKNITDIFNHLVDNFISNPNKETLLNTEQIAFVPSIPYIQI